MSREEIYEQLNEVFRDVFDDDTIDVNDQTTSSDIEDQPNRLSKPTAI